MSAKVCALLLFCVCNVSVSVADWMANESFTIDYVLNLGNKFNHPVLQLLGKGFKDLAGALDAEIREREKEIVEQTGPQGKETFFTYVCHLMACGQWSEWSECPEWPGLYTLTQRTRQCGLNNTLCTYPSTWTETEEDGCGRPPRGPYQRKCPSPYEVVDGFCLWYNSHGSTKSRTEEMCKDKDNGHLVNINTLARYNAIDKLLLGRGYTGTIYIDGHRQAPYTNFNYKNGPDPDVDKWSLSEPSNGNSELCKVQEGSSTRKWYDRECNNSYDSVCEIFLNN